MGWFGRLLGRESAEESGTAEYTEETVDMAELPKWVDQRLDADFNKIKPAIQEQFSKLLEEKYNLLVNLEELGMAQLQNPNISEREKQVMEGNRASYISQHKQFLNMVDVSEDISCKETSQFCKNFEELLLRLSKSTARGHLVMNEFFADHARKINANIKVMSEAVTKIQEILEDGNVGIETVDDVRKAAAELQSKSRLISEVGGELGMLKKKLDNSNFLKEKLHKNIAQLKQTEEYSAFEGANSQREELWKQVKRVEEELSSIFSPIQKAMKKYERMVVEDTALFTRYTEDPVSGLLDDEGLKILVLLERMKAAIESGSIELKEPEKAVQRISEMNKEQLAELRERYSEAKTSIKRIDNDIRNSNVLQEMNDTQYKIEHTESQIRMLQEKIEKAQKTEGKVDIDELRGIVQEKIREAFGTKVRITCGDSVQG